MERREIEQFLQNVGRAAYTLNHHAIAVGRVLEEQVRRVQMAIKPYEGQIRNAQEYAKRTMLSLADVAERIGPFVLQLQRAIEQLPQRTRDELEILADHGWYIDPEMPCTASTELAQLFKDGKDEEADECLGKYYDGQSQQIESRLATRFPARAGILREAFAAHRNGSYALSVPVLLAQADGVCKELLGVQLYGKTQGGNSTQVRDALAQVHVEPLSEALLAPFLKPFTINAGPNQRTESDLNRHAVLHGESVTYNSFRNSCKAISLLAFTEWALSERFSKIK
jgi:hypothetical protein